MPPAIRLDASCPGCNNHAHFFCPRGPMKNAPSFEEALALLEQVVERLENDEVPLEEAMRLFEEGVKNAAVCQKALERVELKVEKLMRGKNGELKLTGLDEA